MEYVIEMLALPKRFPGIKANDDVTLRVRQGEIHALLGENGAGKSTLMSVLFGLYQPEKGIIKVRGKEVAIANPNIANEHGIGMVHQHFKLVENYTVTENIILGMEPKKSFGRVDIKSAANKVKEISERYGLSVDPMRNRGYHRRMQQRVEILKMLYRNAEILIFDEPTAVLTPQEIRELMKIMKELVNEGKSVILITHKLKEIKEVSDRCTVLRKGRYIGTVDVATTTEEQMAEMMVGREVSFKVDKEAASPTDVVLSVKNINAINNRRLPAVKNLSLEVKRGEIMCVAGIDGNGQTELIEAITGLRKLESGDIYLNGKHLEKLSIRQRTMEGVGHIPEDRHKHGLVLDFSLEENIALQTYFEQPLSDKGIINFGERRKLSDRLIEEFDVRSGQGSIPRREACQAAQQKAIMPGMDRSRSCSSPAQLPRLMSVPSNTSDQEDC